MKTDSQLKNSGFSDGKLSELAKFYQSFISKPKITGAVAPSGRQLARLMAKKIDPGYQGRVLELGPGTGVVTREILNSGVKPENLAVLEYCEKMCRNLKGKFENVEIVNGDAFDIRNTLPECESGTLAAVVSSLPLLNFPVSSRQRLLLDLLELLQPGAPFIQFSYGPKPPIESDSEEIVVEKSKWIFANIPPARVWTYCRIEA